MLVRSLLALLAVALVFTGLLIASRAFARGRFGRGQRFLRVLETLPLAHACTLHVVRVAGRELVVGASSSGIALICEVSRDQTLRE